MTARHDDPARRPPLAFDDTAGPGPALVLLHGFPLDRRVWDAQRADLAARCRVITPDLRGFGASHDDRPFTIESLADDVHALLRQIDALPCILCGLSMGGYVALAFARKYAGDLAGLVLMDTRAEGDTPEGKQGRQKMIELARSPGGGKAVSDQMMPRLLRTGAEQHAPDVVRRLRAITESCPPLTIEHALAAMRDRPDQRDLLPQLRLPVLILMGEADVITPPAVGEQMHAAIPNSTFHVIANAGHMPLMEQPQEVNEALRSFLNKVGGLATSGD